MATPTMPSDPDGGNHLRARLKINLAQREFEVEGSEAFVNAYIERFNGWLAHFDSKAAPSPTSAMPSTFGELFQFLPARASDVDRMLVAGYFCTLRNVDQAFSTGEARKRLIEQGIDPGNPSQCVIQSLNARRLIKPARNRFRMSQVGIAYLHDLLGDAAWAKLAPQP